MNLSSEQALEYVTATVATAVMQKMTGSIELHLKDGVLMKVHKTNVEHPKQTEG